MKGYSAKVLQLEHWILTEYIHVLSNARNTAIEMRHNEFCDDLTTASDLLRAKQEYINKIEGEIFRKKEELHYLNRIMSGELER